MTRINNIENACFIEDIVDFKIIYKNYTYLSTLMYFMYIIIIYKKLQNGFFVKNTQVAVAVDVPLREKRVGVWEKTSSSIGNAYTWQLRLADIKPALQRWPFFGCLLFFYACPCWYHLGQTYPWWCSNEN